LGAIDVQTINGVQNADAVWQHILPPPQSTDTTGGPMGQPITINLDLNSTTTVGQYIFTIYCPSGACGKSSASNVVFSSAITMMSLFLALMFNKIN